MASLLERLFPKINKSLVSGRGPASGMQSPDNKPDFNKALNTVAGVGQTAGKLATSIPASVISRIDPSTKPATQSLQNIFKPKNQAQEIGQGLGTALTYAVTAGPMAATRTAAQAPAAIAALGRFAPTARLAIGSAVEGIGLGGLNKALGASDEEATRSGLLTAGLGFGLGAAGSALSKLPVSNWSTILRQTPTETAKNPTLAQDASKLGMVGSRQGLLDQARGRIQQLEVGLDDLLGQSKGKINAKVVSGALDDLRATYAQIPGETASVKALDTLKKDIASKLKGPNLTAAGANQVKRDIYNIVSKSYGKGMLEIPAKTEGQKAIARAIKEEIEKLVPAAKDTNKQLGLYINIKKALEKAIIRSRGKGIWGTGLTFTDLLVGGGASAAFGGPAGVAAVAGAKALDAPITRSAGSQIINYFNNLSPTKKELFYVGIRALSDNLTSEKETGSPASGDIEETTVTETPVDINSTSSGTPERKRAVVQQMAQDLQGGASAQELLDELAKGNPGHPIVQVIQEDLQSGKSPEEILQAIITENS